MTSLLRPAKISSPSALRVARSPVASHPGSRACNPPCCHTWEAIESPRTRISPSAPICTSRPARRFTNAAPGNLERVVQRHQRGGLGHPITLDQRKAKGGPKALQVSRQGSSTGYKRPELKPQPAMQRHGSATSVSQSARPGRLPRFRAARETQPPPSPAADRAPGEPPPGPRCAPA